MGTSSLNTPKMRFPEFNGKLNTSLLGEIASFSKGKGVSKADIEENGMTECIRYGELYTEYGETISKIVSKTNIDPDELILSEFNDVIIPASGETSIDIATASCVLKDGVALGGDLNIIKSELNGVYLSYYLNTAKKMDIANLAQGNSVVHIYPSQLRTLKIIFPEKTEQLKIASFLTAIDTKIQQLTQKKTLLERYKKGVMQKIFNQEIRFKDEKGKDFPEWEEKTLGELLDFEQPTKYIVSSTEYDNSYQTPVLTAGKTFILGYTNETEGIFNKNLPVIIFDDFTTATQFVDFQFKVKSSAMKILSAKKESNITFIYEAMQNLDYVVGGHERHWISKYSQLLIQVPSKAEQDKIATFLSKISKKNNLVNNQLEKTKEWKKGLLQQLFV